MPITGQDGDVTFEFIADRPTLDFVATVAERGTTNEEKLQTPADLVQWARESRIIDDLAAVTNAELREARAVRDAIFGLIAALIDGAQPSPADRALVNRTAGGRQPVLHLGDGGNVHRTGGLDALLSDLATDCLDLFDSPDRAALHWCADSKCTRPFIDRSRGQRRRWCGMKGCGDRAKAAAYRQRQRQGSDSHSPQRSLRVSEQH
jgi:predicted RNA-binding Zn ribbon-like protein